MIFLPNGVKFEFKVASGALAYDGKGWFWDHPLRWLGLIDPSLFLVTTRSLTLEPRKGNLRLWHVLGRGCVRHLRGGVVNSVGLSNHGFDWWCETVGENIRSTPVERHKIKLAVSIAGRRSELVEMAERLNLYNIAAIEVNVSCPNSGGIPSVEDTVDAVCAVYERTGHPVILKLSAAQNYCEIVRQAAGTFSAVDINSVPWKMVFGDASNPVARYGGGGVSGKAAQAKNWKVAEDLVKQGIAPVIGPSVWRYPDIGYLFDAVGVDAVSFGAIHLPNLWRPWTWDRPTRPTRFVRRYSRERIEKEFSACR